MSQKMKAYVEGIRFEGIAATYSVTVRKGAYIDGEVVEITTLVRFGLDETPFDDLLDRALEDIDMVRTGSFLPHQGHWECWCAKAES
jgi:hypothetical protein